MDRIDRDLLARLRENGRASASTLAAAVGVSRGTVQNRIDRLLRDGVIARFTVELPEQHTPDLVRAVMLIEVNGRSVSPVVRSLTGLAEVRTVHTTNGAWDLVVELAASNLTVFDRALRLIRNIEGVENTETSILLSSTREHAIKR